MRFQVLNESSCQLNVSIKEAQNKPFVRRSYLNAVLCHIAYFGSLSVGRGPPPKNETWYSILCTNGVPSVPIIPTYKLKRNVLQKLESALKIQINYDVYKKIIVRTHHIAFFGGHSVLPTPSTFCIFALHGCGYVNLPNTNKVF